MAEKNTNSKKTSLEKGTSKAASARSKKALEEQQQRMKEAALAQSRRRRHLTSVILFALGLFVLLASVIPGSEGWRAIFDFTHGVFGYSAFLVGPVLMYIAVLVSLNKPEKRVGFSAFKLSMLILLVCAAVQIFAVGRNEGENFGELISNLYVQGMEFRGGGVLSFILGSPLLMLGQLGAAIIVIILALVIFLLVSGLSVADLVERMANPVKKAKEATGEHIKRRKEEKALAEQEYERMEQEREEQQQREQKERDEVREEIERGQEELENKRRFNKMLNAIEKRNETPRNKNEAPTPELPLPEENAAPAPEQKPDPDFLPELPDMKPDSEQSSDESSDYMQELKNYILQKNQALIDASEEPDEDELEDRDAQLVSIMDAIHRFDSENEKPSKISEIIDVPKPSTDSDKATADEPARPAETIFAADAPKQEVVQPAAEPQEEKKTLNLTLNELYQLPPMSLLNPVEHSIAQEDIESEIQKNSDTLVETLKSFGVQTKIVGVSRGPSVTRYELQPAPGVKISKITGLVDDITLNLASAGVRIEAPIPNKAAVGIEVPNKQKETVYFRELVDTPEFKKTFDKKLETVLGKDISGETVSCNVAKMPHLLIAGTTGSGKSVCVNSIIMSILMKSTPEDVRFIMIDPKKVEFMMYNGIPHLLIPVVTDAKKAAGALAWAVNEMLNRYKAFSENNVRDFGGYNQLAAEPDSGLEKMSHIVIFIDELADLMMASPKDVEDSIVRLAQMARAAGMHLVIATQRPTVNVVTGLIKANIPSRIALMVASQMDSRVILDSSGAEKLLGNGDMLYMPVGMPKPVRIQGCYVADKEVERVVEFIKQVFTAEYDQTIMDEIERQTEMVNSAEKSSDSSDDGDIDTSDDKLEEAIDFVVEAGQASTSLLQRRLKLGYGRAARIIDIMEEMGVVGPYEGSKPRQVLMTKQEWYERKMNKK
ncbi:MAG: DNA translocase FtsK 4TM domain-containing protein [Oscillospiraceae bacterium]